MTDTPRTEAGRALAEWWYDEDGSNFEHLLDAILAIEVEARRDLLDRLQAGVEGLPSIDLAFRNEDPRIDPRPEAYARVEALLRLIEPVPVISEHQAVRAALHMSAGRCRDGRFESCYDGFHTPPVVFSEWWPIEQEREP